MKQKIERVRAHHGMCLCFFKGKGYSSAFTDNMWDTLEYLRKENPIVEIVDRDDQICASCPNLLLLKETDNQAGSNRDDDGIKIRNNTPECGKTPHFRKACITAEKVFRYDNGVLAACGLEAGTRMHWLEFQAVVKEKVIESGKREEICGDCSWNEICR